MFQDRRDAGRALAKAVQTTGDWHGATILGLPRGGVPVAYEVASALHLPLDVFVVRKLGVPGQEELAMGAIASGGGIVLNQRVIDALSISPETVEAVVQRETTELQRREVSYRDGLPPLQLQNATVMLIDDGLATGASMLAAVRALRPLAHRIIVAVPVAATSTCDALRAEVDRIVCAVTPEPMFAIGSFYADFRQTSDEEVRSLLAQAAGNRHAPQVV
jgi:predicted phosphoribosyltransferase